MFPQKGLGNLTMFVDGKTHCFGCAFQIKEDVVGEDGSERPEQIGCFAGRLEQFEDNGVEIEEAYNEEENYYVIKNKVCSMYRTKGWTAKQKTISIPEWIRLAEEEIVGRMVDVVVLVHSYNSKEEIEGFLHILDNQSWGHVANVHLMLTDTMDSYSVKLVPSEYIKMLSKHNFKWKFHHIVDKNMSYGDMINRVGDKCTSFYYAVFQPDFPLPTDFIEKLFDRTYRKLKAFSIAEPAGFFSGLIIQSKAHRVVQGNGHEKSAEWKIRELAEEQKLSHMIIKYEDLYA